MGLKRWVKQQYHDISTRINIRRRAKKKDPKVVLGASAHVQDGWIGTEFNQLNVVHDKEWQALFRPGTLSAVCAEHVWEHIEPADGLQAVINCYKFLQPGGSLRIAVPDGNHPDPTYIEHVRPGGSGPGCDDHRVLYTVESLSAMLQQAGFETHPREYFDAQGEFHATAWDDKGGVIRRSKDGDPRNADGNPNYTSLIVDGVKPAAGSTVTERAA